MKKNKELKKEYEKMVAKALIGNPPNMYVYYKIWNWVEKELKKARGAG